MVPVDQGRDLGGATASHAQAHWRGRKVWNRQRTQREKVEAYLSYKLWKILCALFYQLIQAFWELRVGRITRFI